MFVVGVVDVSCKAECRLGSRGVRSRSAHVIGALFAAATQAVQAASFALRHLWRNTHTISVPATQAGMCASFKTSSVSDRKGMNITARHLCLPVYCNGMWCRSHSESWGSVTARLVLILMHFQVLATQIKRRQRALGVFFWEFLFLYLFLTNMTVCWRALPVYRMVLLYWIPDIQYDSMNLTFLLKKSSKKGQNRVTFSGFLVPMMLCMGLVWECECGRNIPG